MPFVGNPSGGGFRRKAPNSAQSPHAGVHGTAHSTVVDDAPVQTTESEERAPLLDGQHSSSRPHRSSGSSNSVIVSPSVRALAALSGSPLPISPQRIEAEATRRTSSVPRSRLQSPSSGLGSQRRATYPSSTANTADLIEAFPEPPLHHVRSRNSAPARMSLDMREAQAQFRDENCVQQQRAVANGAMRFVSQTHSATMITGPAQIPGEETVVPVTLTSHGRASSHKHGHLRARMSFRMGVDGAQESGEGEHEQAKWASHCFICQAKRAVHRVSSRWAGSRAHTRIRLTK